MALIHAVRMDRVVAAKLLLEHGADAAANHVRYSECVLYTFVCVPVVL